MPTPRPRVFVFDSPRTCSLLFYRLFSTHPDTRQCFFPFANAGMLGPERIGSLEEHTLEQGHQTTDPKFLGETYEAASSKLEHWIQDVETEGRVPWIKDHSLLLVQHDLLLKMLRNEPISPVPSNPTLLPDALFNSFTPVFLIRHPALAIPSFYRKQLPFWGFAPADLAFKLYSTNRFTRIISDAYTSTRSMPIVVDAHDLVYKTEKLVGALCPLLGLDAAAVKYDWESVGREWVGESESLKELAKWFFVDALGSTGVIRGPVVDSELDLDVEEEKWEGEFGTDVAKGLRELVEEDMPNYEFLRGVSVLGGQVGMCSSSHCAPL